MEKNLIPHSLSLDELAAYFDGETRAYTPEEEAFLRGVEAGALDLEEKEYPLTRTLRLRKPLRLRGNGATISGVHQEFGFYLSAGNTVFSDLKLRGFSHAVVLDPLGGTMEHVRMERIDVALEDVGFEYGSTVSGGVMRDIHFVECEITGSGAWEDNDAGGSLSTPFSGAAAFARSDGEIRDCLLEDIWFERNRINGGLRCAFNHCAGFMSFRSFGRIQASFVNNTVRGTHYIGNYTEQCWDAVFNIVASFMNASGSLMEGIEIADNHCGFGITTLYLFPGEPIHGSNVGSVIRGVEMHDNVFQCTVPDVGEPIRGVFLAAGRLDYFPHAEVRDCVLEDIRIYNNTFDGAGPVLTGAYTLLDGEGYCENNVLRKVHIHDNRILNADYAFTVEGAQMEGRRYDWNFGFPRHDKKYLDPVEDDSVVLMRMKNNRVEDVLIEDNTIEGYRYRVLASGADIRGHGLAEDNKACKNIVMRNNHYGVGECHVRVAHYIGEDFCRDGGGNEVDEALRER